MEKITVLVRKLAVLAIAATTTVSIAFAQAAAPPSEDSIAPTPEDLEREAAIEAFTKKQIAADYGPKFKQAAEEFNVPVEILMGISFAETRHEHLMWPEGERYSPENGMPRPYGIMSLWDNEFFGHSLVDAAKLIGKDPEELKRDPLQNMRGAAALLRKFYEENEKPKYAKDGSLESWKYAIVKYCGIPEPDLSHSHAWDVYDFLSQGYDQYGIKLPQVPDLDLKPLWEETKAIKEEQRKINEAKWRAEGKMDDVILEEYQGPDGMWYSRPKQTNTTDSADAKIASDPERKSKKAVAEPVVAVTPAGGQGSWMMWAGIIGAAAVILGLLVFRKKPEAKK